ADACRLSGVDVDDDALEHRDHAIAGERVLPRLERRMPDLGLDEIHVAHFALFVRRGGDLLGIGRPEQNRPITAGPAGVVRRVAEVLGAFGRELLLVTGCHVADPEIPIANERGALAVRRHRDRCRRAAASATASASAATTTASTGG